MPDLFPFQVTGAEWLAGQARGLLADAMGLGKTAQAVRACDHVAADRVLVVCKAIAKQNWVREFGRFSTRPEHWADAQILGGPENTLRRANLTVINYDLIHRPEYLRQLLKGRWDVIVFDESHSLKSPDARRTQACLDPERGLWTRAGRVWGLSGTPAPNHWGELYPWLRALHPESVRGLDQEAFTRRYMFVKDTPYGLRVLGIADKDGLKAVLAPVLLRRQRHEVLPDLPPLMVDLLPLSGPEALPQALRQFENHPEREAIKALLNALGPDADPEDIITGAEMDLSELRRLYGLAKVPLIVDQVTDELESGQDKIVVFAWHREVLAQLEKALVKYHPVVVMGGTTPSARVEFVDRFQNDRQVRVFIGNISAAGTSITLTAANRLIFAEYSWTPADNEQATLRILRIGQDRPCRVSYASLAGSLDETITAVYQRKAALLAAVFD